MGRMRAIAVAVAMVAGALASVAHPAAAGGQPVLMVVASPGARTAAEDFVAQRLVTAGYELTFADDDTVTAAAATGKAFVLVAQTAAATQTTTALRNVTVPVWVAKPTMLDDFGLTGTNAGDAGFKTATPLTITAPGHPMTAGRTGTIAFQNGKSISYGVAPASATVIARSGTDATIYTIAPGATLTTGNPAPACRLTFPLYTNGPLSLTPDGLALLDATAAWAATNCTTPAPPGGPAITHVIEVSVDGLNPDAITQLGAAGTPTFHRLISQGASTLNARTAVEITRTLPNHTSIMTSRPVLGPSGHQVTINEDDGSTLQATAGQYVAGVFDVVHDNGGSTALYPGSPKFDFLERSWNASNGAVDLTGVDNGRDKVDTYQRGAGDVATAALLARVRSDLPAFSFIHYAAADTAGHTYGFMSPTYLQAVTEVDGQIGQLLDAVAADPALQANTVVLVTADHGGLGLAHSDPLDVVNYRVPFFAWGTGVSAGADLYALNPQRSDPGTSQPAYTSATPPIRAAESANLVTGLLGLPPVSGSTIDADQSLRLGTR